MSFSRPLLALSLPLFLAAAAPGPAIPAETAHDYLQISAPIAQGVHVLRQSAPNFAGVIGNVTVIEQSDGLVLIDSGASHGNGERVVEMVRAISSKPVKTVVITHWHNDHPLGLSAIVAAWPGVDIIAHEAAAADMEAGRLGKIPRAPSAEYETTRIEALHKAYEQVRAEDASKAESAEEKRGWKRAFVALPLRVADVAGTYLVMPKRTFAERLALPDATAPVELMFLGRANTSGDISAWLPKQCVLVAGDAVVEPIPYMVL
jgi:glyoxylase-like metal-dependent hydrolase (beta-lactamase superfamily II)